jgi:pimeloyl-ACP methyl ester carboxylesterase
MGYRWVTTSDGVVLAVRESGPKDAPVLVCVHGYPDDSSLWDGVRALLDDDYRVVAYDVRGAGESGRPRERAAYRLDRLAEDLRAVVDEVSPDAPVHLLAHDWGSVQAWYALGHGEPPRVRSFTSISGPSLAQGNRWLAKQFSARSTWLRGARQVAGSAYIALFRLPWLPVAIVRLGLFDLALRTDRSRGGHRSRRADAVSGLELYRANMRFGLPRRRLPVTKSAAVGVPVMVLAPRADRYVSVGMQTELDGLVPDLRVHELDGGHWLPLSRPAVIASHVREFIGG